MNLRRITAILLATLIVSCAACKQGSLSSTFSYWFMSPLSPNHYQLDPSVKKSNGLATVDTRIVDGLAPANELSNVTPSRWVQIDKPRMIPYSGIDQFTPQVSHDAGYTMQAAAPPQQMQPQYTVPQHPLQQYEQRVAYAREPQASYNGNYPPQRTIQPETAEITPVTGNSDAEKKRMVPPIFQQQQREINEPYVEAPPQSNKLTFGEDTVTLYLGAAPEEKSSRPYFAMDEFPVKDNNNVTTFPHTGKLKPMGMQQQDRSEELTIDPALANRPMPAKQRHAIRPGAAMESFADGGDAGRSVRVRDDLSMTGLNAEDTVVIFDTEKGQKSVLPSNRVNVYSPRFGSVRHVEGIYVGEQRELATAANGNMRLRIRDGAQSAGKTEQESEALYARSRDQLEGTRGTSRGNKIVTKNAISAYSSNDLARGYSNLLKQEWIASSETAVLQRARANAVAWSGNERLMVRANTSTLKEMHGIDTVQHVFSVEDGEQPQELRLYKAASTDSAQSGETVEFTLRYENTGKEILRNVTLLDSLTARLEFIPGSAKSSLPASFFVEPNEAGSFVLRWELREELRPGDYGVIVFQCRVR